MNDQLLPYICLIEDSFDKKKIPDYHLSIQLSPEGLTFCVLDPKQNRHLALESYSFHDFSPEKKLTQPLSLLISQSDLLHQGYGAVRIIYESPVSVLIPKPLFIREQAKLYLDFNHELVEADVILYDYLNHLEAYNIFTIPGYIELFLREKFPEAELHHATSSLLESIFLSRPFIDFPESLYVYIRNSYFDVIYLEDRQIRFCNAFHYKTREDLVYFLIFVVEQLKLNPEHLTLILMGEIRKDSAAWELVRKYVRNVDFIQRNEEMGYSHVFDELPGHSYYNLLNLHLCAL